MKTPPHSSDKILMTSTPSNASLMMEDVLLMLDNKEQLKREKEQETTLNQMLLRSGNQKFSKIKVASEYDGKIEKSLKNSEHPSNSTSSSEGKLRSQEQSGTSYCSLTEKISKCTMQMIDLAEVKKSRQIQLVKSQDGNEEWIKEAKNSLCKCKELQNPKDILEKQRNQLQNVNQHLTQTHHSFHIRNQKEGKMTAVTCERERLSGSRKFWQKKCFDLKETKERLKIEIPELRKEKSSLEQVLERNQSEMQQIKEKETAAKSELETHRQLLQTLEAEKLNLEMTLQECYYSKQMLQTAFEKLQADKDSTEKKLMTELRNAKADIDLLKSSLTSANRMQEVINSSNKRHREKSVT